jgi:hypothetical protein
VSVPVPLWSSILPDNVMDPPPEHGSVSLIALVGCKRPFDVALNALCVVDLIVVGNWALRLSMPKTLAVNRVECKSPFDVSLHTWGVADVVGIEI